MPVKVDFKKSMKEYYQPSPKEVVEIDELVLVEE